MMFASVDSNNWFVCSDARPEAEVRLFLFPYAGGGPAVFNKWPSEFPRNIEVWIAHYPGRGSRHREAPIKQIITLAEKYFRAIQPLLDKPFALFGHSLGGLVAFELTRQLRQHNCPQPQILFASGCGAPQVPDPNPPIHKCTDLEFIKSLQELNGLPSELLHHSEVMQLLLPIARADFEAVERYQFHPNEFLLHTPIFAMVGLEDPRVSRERVEGWALHTDAGFRPQYFPGDHFFISGCREAVITFIVKELAASHEKN